MIKKALSSLLVLASLAFAQKTLEVWIMPNSPQPAEDFKALVAPFEKAHGVGTPRGQALGQGARGVAQLLHRLEHRPHLLRGDPGGAVEHP